MRQNGLVNNCLRVFDLVAVDGADGGKNDASRPSSMALRVIANAAFLGAKRHLFERDKTVFAALIAR